jgi:hypothetical protein
MARAKVTEASLGRRLERLKQILGLGRDLVLIWEPASNPMVKGELKGRALFIYEPDPEKAQRVMIHEFLEYLLSQYYLAPSLMAGKGILTTHAHHTKEQLISAIAVILEKILNASKAP